MAFDLNKAYTWAVQTCNAPNVGYSQAYRNQKTVNGITYYDCSSFINYALIAGGQATPGYAPASNPFTTSSMGAALLSYGWKEVPATGDLLPGDVGWVKGHTEMCYRGGKGKGVFMGAHTDNAALANQVSIGSSSGNPNYESSWSKVYRYGDGGASGGYGSSIYVIAALAGNAWRESHINPTLSQQGGGAYGLFQWDGGRRDAYYQWAQENSYLANNPYAQMEYLVVEGDWQGSFAGISSLNEFLASTSTDIASLTEAFCTCWERPGIPALQERIDFANEAFDYINAHANDTSIIDWEVVPMYYLSRQQALHNAVLMYRFYSAGGGGGGTIGKKRKCMPIWMWIQPYQFDIRF